MKALFTRITGPGMVHPKVTAALVIKKTKSKRVEAERVCADNVRPQFDSSYPWEKRAFTPLDFYSGELQHLLRTPGEHAVHTTLSLFACSISTIPSCKSILVIPKAAARP